MSIDISKALNESKLDEFVGKSNIPIVKDHFKKKMLKADDDSDFILDE